MKHSRTKKDLIERIIKEAEYIREHKSTVRETCKHFGVCKNTIYVDMVKNLPKINYTLYKEIEGILQENKRQRHIRGGMATKIKFKGE